MGGNAIKSSSRMDRSTYIRVSKYICDKIIGLNFKIPHTLHDKESFGDVDIIVDSNDFTNVLKALAKYIVETVKNGNITSIGIAFESSIVQVDLVCVRADKLNNVHTYMSYGFFGMIVGIVLARHDLIYGIQGLETKQEHVILSVDPVEILAFLDIDLPDLPDMHDLHGVECACARDLVIALLHCVIRKSTWASFWRERTSMNVYWLLSTCYMIVCQIK